MESGVRHGRDAWFSLVRKLDLRVEARYRGHDGLRNWNQGYEDVWGGQVHIELEAYFDLGEQTLALGVLHPRGRQRGAETTLRLAQVGRWRDGLCVYLKSYEDLDEALGSLASRRTSWS
jgi:hypothetical protein